MKSKELYEEALKLFPGGVNSPARAIKPYPFYVERAEGPYLYTVDGEALIDYCLAFGPLILGHKNRVVLEAVREQLEKGWLYGTVYELEIELAKKITSHYPSIDMVRFVNTGTEATMNAIRLARGFTGRSKIVKFEGCYHGAHDYLLVRAGSGATTWGHPTSKGIPEDAIKNTIVLPYNNLEALEKTMRQRGEEVAAVIVEPVIGNSGLILPREGFLEGIRELTRAYGSLFILDEVITGYRLGFGGAQEYFNIRADLTTLGKIVGGGFPIGVFGGKREIMEMVSPAGPVYNAGTFNAHPVSIVAGLATIRELEKGYPYRIAEEAAKSLYETFSEMVDRLNLKARVYALKSMVQIFFTGEDVVDYETALKSDKEKYMKLHREALKEGVYLAPSQFETNFTSSAHTREVVEKAENSLKKAFYKAFR